MDAARALFRTATGGLRPAQCMLIGALMGVPLVCAAAASALPPPGTSAVPLPRTSRVGQAGIYRLDGRTTASGEVYNRNALTAAHRSLQDRIEERSAQRLVAVDHSEKEAGRVARIDEPFPPKHGIAIGHRALQIS